MPLVLRVTAEMSCVMREVLLPCCRERWDSRFVVRVKFACPFLRRQKAGQCSRRVHPGNLPATQTSGSNLEGVLSRCLQFGDGLSQPHRACHGDMEIREGNRRKQGGPILVRWYRALARQKALLADYGRLPLAEVEHVTGRRMPGTRGGSRACGHCLMSSERALYSGCVVQ